MAHLKTCPDKEPPKSTHLFGKDLILKGFPKKRIKTISEEVQGSGTGPTKEISHIQIKEVAMQKENNPSGYYYASPPEPDTPEITVRFVLPRDREEFECCYQGAAWKALVGELDRHLRDWLKYGHKFSGADEALEAVSNLIYEIMEDYHITID